MRLCASLAVCAALVAGCTEQRLLTYQGRPAQSALECEAAYQAALDRSDTVSVDYSSGTSVAAAGMAVSFARGMQKSAYRNCFARVANLPNGSGARVTTIAPQPGAPMPVRRERQPVAVPRDAGCPPGVSGLYGGTLVC